MTNLFDKFQEGEKEEVQIKRDLNQLTSKCKHYLDPFSLFQFKLNFYYNFIYYLFLAALDLRCFAQVFSICDKQGLLSSCCAGLLTVLASLAANGLQARRFHQCSAQAQWLQHGALRHVGFALVVGAHRLSRCSSWALQQGLSSWGTQAQLLGGMWAFPGPRIKSMSPALADGFLSTVPPKSRMIKFLNYYTIRNLNIDQI